MVRQYELEGNWEEAIVAFAWSVLGKLRKTSNLGGWCLDQDQA
jgi:hypothetical protein